MALSDTDRVLLAETIDHLMTVDVPGRGFIGPAYDAARKLSGKPLTQDVGDRLIDLFKGNPKRSVLIATGATFQRPGVPDYIGEMDGPPGAIALARFMGRVFSAVPILVTDPGQGEMLANACKSSGLYALPFDDLSFQASNAPHVSAVHIVELPAEDAGAREVSQDLLQKCRPVALITIEKGGRNEHGVFHSSSGINNSKGKAHVEPLFDACGKAGVLTVGIGDGGNELGSGNIRDFLLTRFPHMAKCKCPCGGGIVATQKADCLIVATVSNWGTYGLITYMAAVNNMPYAAHSPAREKTLLRACAAAGYIHIDGYRASAVDGMPEETHVAFVSLLSCMVHWPPLRLGGTGFLADMLAK